ncbi:MAG: MerR family transcriptional regulator [Dehalococcoidia bacterium]|nr:MerR family transcriptional regulator [Dehalococcoidia bacterium]
MPIEIDGMTYFRTQEVARKIRISRATLLRWLKAGVLKKQTRDVRGWRLFTEEDIAELRGISNTVEIIERDSAL